MVRLLAPLVMRDLVSKHLLSSGCTRKTSEACALRLQSCTLAPLRFEKTRTSTYACCYCFPVPNFALAQQSHETVEETNGRVLRNIHYTFKLFFFNSVCENTVLTCLGHKFCVDVLFYVKFSLKQIIKHTEGLGLNGNCFLVTPHYISLCRYGCLLPSRLTYCRKHEPT